MDGRTGNLRALERLAAEQHLVFSRDQALRNGFTRDMQYDRRAGGDWVEVFPGVMRFASSPITFRMRAMAATLWATPDGLISHLSAARLWNLEGVSRPAELHLTVPSERRLRHEEVVVHRSGDLLPADCARTHDIPVTSAVRTVLDIAPLVDQGALEVAIEDGLRRGLFRVGQLERRSAGRRGKGFAGSGIVADLIGRHGSAIADSGWEIRLEQLLVDGDVPTPVRQLAVGTVLGTLHVDLGYPGPPVIAFEYDSDRWHSGVRRRHADMERRNALRAAGCVVIEVTAALMANRRRLLATVRGVIDNASHSSVP